MTRASASRASPSREGATVSFDYDDVGRPVSTTDPLMHKRTTVRNKLGRVIATTDALGYTVQLERDKQQRITKVIDQLGRQTALTYDKRGLLAAADRDGIGAGRLLARRDRPVGEDY
jgi:YD repeat-containing protein